MNQPFRWPLAAVHLAVFLAWGAPQPALAQVQDTLDTGAAIGIVLSQQPLTHALTELARQTGATLVAPPSLLEGKTAPALSGRYTPQQALNRLLAGSGLTGNLQGRILTIRAIAAESPSAVAETLPTVTVTAKGENEKDLPFRTAGSRNVLTRDDIERFRGTSVGDIFQGIPGVLVGENRNSGGLDVNIRGMQGQGRVPVLVDGARQETTVYRGYSGVSSRSYIDPDLIGGIDIEKGPSMAAGATGATGGVVNMRTINADDIVRPGETFGIRLRGSAIGNNSGKRARVGSPSGINVGGMGATGSNGVYRTDCTVSQTPCSGPFDLANVYGPTQSLNRPDTFDLKGGAGSIALAKRVEAADFVAAYAQRSQGNYYAGKHGPTPWLDLSDRTDRGFWTEVRPVMGGASRFRAEERIVNSNFESESALLKGKFYLPKEQELELSYLYYRSVYGQLMPSQLQWFGQVRQSEDSTVDANTFASRYQWNPTDNPYIKLRANLWHTDTRSANGLYNINPALDEILNVRVNERYQRTGADLSNSTRFGTWGGIRLDYGMSVQEERISSDEEITSTSFARAGQRNEFSAFTNAQWKPIPQLTLDAGLRYTRFKSKDDKPLWSSTVCQDTDGDGVCDNLYAPENQRSGSAPVASITWEPSDGLQFYGRYAEALRMPSLFETTSGFSVGTTLDASLRPEHAKNREIGVNYLKDGVWRSNDKLRLKFAYFRNHTTDYLTRTIPNTWEDASVGLNAAMFRMRNIDSADFHGYELSGSYDMGVAFAEFSGTRYDFIQTCHYGSYRRYMCTDYGIASSYINNMIPPNWHGSVTLGTRLLERKLTVGVRGTFMGRRNPTPEFNDQTNTGGINFARPVVWHPYRIFDLFASYKVNDRLSFDFNVDNFTDRYYLDALSLGLVPAPGRSVRASVTVQF